MKNRLFHILIISLFVSACSEPSFQEQSNRIEQEFKDGNINKSLILAKNLLRDALDKKNTEQEQNARILLARNYFYLGDYQSALRFYGTIKTSLPNNISIDDLHKSFYLAIKNEDFQLAEQVITALKSSLNTTELKIYQNIFDGVRTEIDIVEIEQIIFV